jgi:hypothetical protein
LVQEIAGPASASRSAPFWPLAMTLGGAALQPANGQANTTPLMVLLVQ